MSSTTGENDLVLAAIELAISDLLNFIKLGKSPEDGLSAFNWLFHLPKIERHGREGHVDTSLPSFIELMDHGFSWEQVIDMVWKRIESECGYGISHCSLEFILAPDLFTEEVRKEIDCLNPMKKKEKIDYRILLVNRLLEKIKAGEIDWTREEKNNKVTYCSIYHSGQDRAYSFIMTRQISKSKSKKRKYVYNFEMQVLIGEEAPRIVKFERGIAKLFNYLDDGPSLNETAAILKDAVLDLESQV